MSTLIQCRECWLVHDAYADCPDRPKAEELERRRNAAYERHAAERDDAERQAKWAHAQKAGAPVEALLTLKRGWEDTKALLAAAKFNRDPEALVLLLLGPTGVGKTLAASLVAVDFAGKWRWNDQPSGVMSEPLIYVDCSTLTRLSAFDAAAKSYVDSLRGCRLLVLEDAGDEGTDLGRGLLVELLMARHAAKRRTVITGNVRPDVFKARYGAAVADRIRASGYVPDLFGEKSRRTKYTGPESRS